jgi:hypothetical protein
MLEISNAPNAHPNSNDGHIRPVPCLSFAFKKGKKELALLVLIDWPSGSIVFCPFIARPNQQPMWVCG